MGSGRNVLVALIAVFAAQFAVTMLSWVGDLTPAGGMWDNVVLVSLAILASLLLFPAVVILAVLSFRRSRNGRVVASIAAAGLLVEIAIVGVTFVTS